MQTNSTLSVLNAVSPLDGRYASRCDGLRPLLSEAGFMAHRVEVEIAWLIGLSDAGLPELAPFTAPARQALRALVAEFSEADAQRMQRRLAGIPFQPGLARQAVDGIEGEG